MNAYEATRIVFSRIQALDSENAAKIMGLLLIQDHGEKEMIRLAFGPETLLHSVIVKARKELGLHPPSSPSSAPISPSPFHRQLSCHNSSSRFGMAPPPPLTITSSPSWAPPSDAAQCPPDDLIISPNQSPAAACSSPFYGDFVDDEFPPIQDQISFLNDPYQDWGPGGPHHRRSFSAAPDLCLSSDGAGGFGWKPCLYFARGFCKNGSSCRFLHGLPDDGSKLDAAIEQQCQELLLRSKSQRLGAAAAAAAFPYSPTGSMPISPSSSKCMNYLLQQQQNESQRAAAAAAAAALMLGGDESHKFMGRSRMDRSDFAGMVNPGSRQIYLTFPADSTFREEDVSNYFSIYGPVQDVRIPYQQKRMFGFVTFVYPETVKLILAKGNPHFVCDARVLVKPYKEKGKVLDKYRKQQQQAERGDFSGFSTPTGLDSRDPYDLQQLGARMLYNSGNSSNQEMLLRRKLEEQQQAAELQHAIEMQGRRFMGLQLLDFKNRSSLQSPSTTISSPTTVTSSAPFSNRSHEGSPTGDKSPIPASSGGEQQQQLLNLKAVNPAAAAAAADKEESAAREGSPNEDSDFQESTGEHNLPDSPFTSPTKASSLFAEDPFTAPGPAASVVESELVAAGSAFNNGNDKGLMASTLLPPTSTLDMASFKSCFFQMPRFSSGHGAVGL